MNSYAGIGSRETPREVLSIFEDVGELLAIKGYTLRSGHAKGADQAFERGCDRVGGRKEIYIPWWGFEGSRSDLVVHDDKAFDIARQFHPNWDVLTDGAKKLQARNSHQILGYSLNDPVDFVICYTRNGLGRGGTGQAIRIAKHLGILVIDVGKFKDMHAEMLKSIIITYIKGV